MTKTRLSNYYGQAGIKPRISEYQPWHTFANVVGAVAEEASGPIHEQLVALGVAKAKGRIPCLENKVTFTITDTEKDVTLTPIYYRGRVAPSFLDLKEVDQSDISRPNMRDRRRLNPAQRAKTALGDIDYELTAEIPVALKLATPLEAVPQEETFRWLLLSGRNEHGATAPLDRSWEADAPEEDHRDRASGIHYDLVDPLSGVTASIARNALVKSFEDSIIKEALGAIAIDVIGMEHPEVEPEQIWTP